MHIQIPFWAIHLVFWVNILSTVFNLGVCRCGNLGCLFLWRTGRRRQFLVCHLQYLQFEIGNGICDDGIIKQIMKHLVDLQDRSNPDA